MPLKSISSVPRSYLGKSNVESRWKLAAHVGAASTSGKRVIVAWVPQRRQRTRSNPKRRWRDYRTPGGGRPVRDFIAGLTENDAAAVLAAMKDVEKNGLAVAQHLEDEIYEVKADGLRQTFRILFSPQGEHDQVLLSLEGFSKKTQKTPPAKIQLAKRRLHSWRTRGRRTGPGLRPQ